MDYADGPRLLADIGGTNARFALEYAPGRIDSIRILPSQNFPGPAEAMEAYLSVQADVTVRHAAIAIADPVNGDRIKMTNHSWEFSIDAVRQRLHFDTLLVVNDFAALARSLPHLQATELEQVGGGNALAGRAIGLIGPGTGLGVGGLIPSAGKWIAIDSEGGHASFSPGDEREIAVLQYCRQLFPHVSAERLVSGPGISLLHRALAARNGAGKTDQLETPDIVQRALAETDALCVETVECFCAMLGTVASNVALTLGARGGMYIGGGVVPHLGGYFARSKFRARFENKGRFSSYLAQIPTYVITAPYPAFAGVAALLSEHLDAA